MLKEIKWVSIAIAAVCVICGIVLLFNPGGTAKSICRIVGVVALINGIVKMIQYYTDGNSATPSKQQLTQGLFELLAAVLLIFMTGTVLNLINLAVGLAIIVYCIFTIQSAMDKQKLGNPYWWISFAAAVVGGILGIIMVFGGISAANAVIRLAGIALLIYGGRQLSTIFLFQGK